MLNCRAVIEVYNRSICDSSAKSDVTTYNKKHTTVITYFCWFKWYQKESPLSVQNIEINGVGLDAHLKDVRGPPLRIFYHDLGQKLYHWDPCLLLIQTVSEHLLLSTQTLEIDGLCRHVHGHVKQLLAQSPQWPCRTNYIPSSREAVSATLEHGSHCRNRITWSLVVAVIDISCSDRLTWQHQLEGHLYNYDTWGISPFNHVPCWKKLHSSTAH